MGFWVLLLTRGTLLTKPCIHLLHSYGDSQGALCSAAAPLSTMPAVPWCMSINVGGQEVCRAKVELGAKRHEGPWRVQFLISRLDQSKAHLSAVPQTAMAADSEPCPACPRAYLVKRGISSLMFTMVTQRAVEAVRFPLSLTPTRRLKLSGNIPSARDRLADTATEEENAVEGARRAGPLSSCLLLRHLQRLPGGAFPLWPWGSLPHSSVWSQSQPSHILHITKFLQWTGPLSRN